VPFPSARPCSGEHLTATSARPPLSFHSPRDEPTAAGRRCRWRGLSGRGDSVRPWLPRTWSRARTGRLRCPWAGSQPDYLAYHDLEWGRPVHDELRLFEKLCLEGFQAGLSWYTILRKRDAFRRAFAGFEPVRVAAFGEADVDRLLADAGIVRSRRKIEATIANARALLALGDTTLERLVWAHAPARHRAPRRSGQVPASIPESTALAVELKRRGFRMVGATTVYAMMQACGVVNDHLTGCFVRDELDATPRPPSRLSSRGPGPDSGSPGGPGPPLGYLGQGIWGERW